MSPNIVTATQKVVISRHNFAEVLQDSITRQRSLHAAVSIAAGELICTFSAGVVQTYPTYLTIQTGLNNHITLQPEFLQYINHSCAPSVFFDTDTMQLLSLKALEPGGEFTFFYPSTEWDMAQPFVCNCGHSSCLQLINGASQLSAETLQQYKLTGFISQQVKQQTFL